MGEIASVEISQSLLAAFSRSFILGVGSSHVRISWLKGTSFRSCFLNVQLVGLKVHYILWRINERETQSFIGKKTNLAQCGSNKPAMTGVSSGKGPMDTHQPDRTCCDWDRHQGEGRECPRVRTRRDTTVGPQIVWLCPPLPLENERSSLP